MNRHDVLERNIVSEEVMGIDIALILDLCKFFAMEIQQMVL